MPQAEVGCHRLGLAGQGARPGRSPLRHQTLSSNIFDNLLDEDDGLPAINIMSSMAWEGASIATTFDAPGEPFDGVQLRPRGQMVIPAPSALAVLTVGGLWAGRRRRRA